MRFLSLASCRLSDDDEVELMEAADEEGGDESVDRVDEAADLCRSMGDGFSSTCSSDCACCCCCWWPLRLR